MKVLVVNELPSDVFSEHLLGNKLFEVSRCSLSEISEKKEIPYELVLTVNHSINVAVKLKNEFPESRIAAVFGGKKDFQPYVSFVYKSNDYDDLNYNSWQEFDGILLSYKIRQEKLLSFFYLNDFNSHKYRVNRNLLPEEEEFIGENFVKYLQSSFGVSFEYLNWLRAWLKEVSSKKIKIQIPKRTIKQLKFSFDNLQKGLPIFSKGDSVNFFDENGSEIVLKNLEHDLQCAVTQADDAEIVIEFSKKIPFRFLENVVSISPNSFQEQKIERMQKDLWSLSSNFNGYRQHFKPAMTIRDLLDYSITKIKVQYPSEVLLNQVSRKITRDSSQMRALIDMLSDKFMVFIKGPAGTGKTFVSATAIYNFVKQQKKVLIVSHSNLGVDNLVSELRHQVHDDLIVRLGNNSEKISSDLKFLENNLQRFVSANSYYQGFVVASTIDSFLTLKDIKKAQFEPDVIICDEASRGLIPEIVPLILAAREKIIFIGDNKQLGNVPVPDFLKNYLQNKLSLTKDGIDKFCDGFFNSVVANNYLSSNLLRINRRSLPVIANLVNEVFYDGELISGRFNPSNQGKFIFLDTKNLSLAFDKREGTSWVNPTEVNLLLKRIIAQIAKQIKNGGSISEFVAITPYMAQINLLKKRSRNDLLFHKTIKDQVYPSNVDRILEKLFITVDAIQGGQRKTVFVSLVRSNDRQDIGFNHDIRRLNVAFSRAQELLVVIGNSESFTECAYDDIKNAFWKIITYAKKHNSYVVL